jgi:hypothetical protein
MEKERKTFLDAVIEGLVTLKAEIGAELMGEVVDITNKYKTDDNEKLVSGIMQEILGMIDNRMGVGDYESGKKA